MDGHAGERETSDILAIRRDLVRLDRAPVDGEGVPQGRLAALRNLGVSTAVRWYADHPTHSCGDGRPATAGKGNRELDARARALAAVIRAVKADRATPALQAEFFAAATSHRGP